MTQPTPSIVELSNIDFQYTSNEATPFRLTLKNFQLLEGEQWILVGPSGSGKSTILNLIAGELLPQKGVIRVLGHSLEQSDYDTRQNFRIEQIGYIFQDFPLVEYLSALENVLLPYRINPSLRLNTVVRERAEGLLKEVGLEGKCLRKPSELSQGERQRVAIARALITEPKLILADEPTAGLDVHRSQSVMQLIQTICRQQNIGLIVVSHEPLIMSMFNNVFDLSAPTGTTVGKGTTPSNEVEQ